MLFLLIKTRIQYYRNYIRYHFDKTTILEIAFIFLIFLFLTIRSPGDIGYNFKWLFQEDFPARWASIFTTLLPIFYLVGEGFARYTLRPAKEWQILGWLPFAKISIANYYLCRYLSKTSLFILMLTLPFWGGSHVEPGLRAIRFIVALGIILTLQLVAFTQASVFRNPNLSSFQKGIRWLLPDILIVGLLVLVAPQLQSWLTGNWSFGLSLLLVTWIIGAIFLRLIQTSFSLREVKTKVYRQSKVSDAVYRRSFIRMVGGIISVFVIRDILLLWRQKKSSCMMLIIGSLILLIISFVVENEQAAYISLLCLEILVGILLINTVLAFFEQDIQTAGMTRALPIAVKTQWWARWLSVAALIVLPMFVPNFILAVKFGIGIEFILFILAALAGIPIIFATLYCNACYGLFPQIKLSGYIIAVSIALLFLFWFFMPFGTFLLLAIMIFWIRKSQKHFQFLEIEW